MTKTERLDRQFYKLINEGKYEEARKLMSKIVDNDVKRLGVKK